MSWVILLDQVFEDLDLDYTDLGGNISWLFPVEAQQVRVTCGYGSIPIHTIFSGMNIHLPAILMWTTGVQGFDTLPHVQSADRSLFLLFAWQMPLGEDRDLSDNIRRAFNEARCSLVCAYTCPLYQDVGNSLRKHEHPRNQRNYTCLSQSLEANISPSSACIWSS